MLSYCKYNIAGCGLPHHRLLHVGGRVSEKSNIVATICSSPTTVLTQPASKTNEFASILPTSIFSASICANGVEQPVRTAFDSFLQKSFLTREIADNLQLNAIRKDCLIVSGFSGSTLTGDMSVV